MGKKKKRIKRHKNKTIQQAPKINDERITLKKSDLEKTISNEYVSFTDGITKHDGEQIENLNYFVYWTMKDRVTIFDSGTILVIDDEGAEEYFRQAFEVKYRIPIPRNDHYDSLIKNQIDKYREQKLNWRKK